MHEGNQKLVLRRGQEGNLHLIANLVLKVLR